MPMIWSKRPEEWVICSGNFTRFVAASGMTPAKTSRWSGADIAILPVPTRIDVSNERDIFLNS